jgi:copper chaperone CopZ
MANVTTFTYLHSTPGRMRIRVPAFCGEEQACRRVEEELAARPGVTRVTANPLTGSVLILFDGRHIDDRRILEALAGLGLQGDLIAPEAKGTFEASSPLAEISTRVGAVLGKELVKAAITRAVGGSQANFLLLFL